MTYQPKNKREELLVELQQISADIDDILNKIDRTRIFLDSLEYSLKVTENLRHKIKLEMYSHVDEQGKNESKEGIHENAA